MKKFFPLAIGLLAVAFLLAFAVGQGKAQQASPASERSTDPQALAPRSSYIPIQGRLTDASGNPLTGPYDMTFNLYDQFTGGTVLCHDTATGVTVENGLFNAYMNMQGCTAIDGRQLYLGIQVGTDPEMTPRQFIDNVVTAWTLRPGANISGTMGNEAILDIDNYSDAGRGLRSEAQATTGVNYAVIGASRSPDGYGGHFYNNGGGVGLYAYTTSYAGFGVIGMQTDYYSMDDYTDFYMSGGLFGGVNGVIGISHETVRVGAGVYGWAQGTTGTSYGVRGKADSTTAYGVHGWATSTTGTTYGIYGRSDSTAGRGVYGLANASSGNTYGVYGEANSSNGHGVHGLADTSGGVGVYGESEIGSGVYGHSGSGYGVYGFSSSANAVYGDTQNALHEYGLYTPDDLWSLNFNLRRAVRQLVRNNGNEPLEAGDVVVFNGMLAPTGVNEPPVILVSKAATANSTAVAGVVYARSSQEGITLEGVAQPGEYLLIVVQGPARVKVSASAGAIQPGDLLSSASQAGFAAKASTLSIQGVSTTLPGTIFAKALEALASADIDHPGEGWIYVFVTLQ